MILERRTGAGAWASSWWATLEIQVAMIAAHLVAGGDLPDPGWIAVSGVLTLLAGRVVLGGRLRAATALPLLLGLQLVGHAWMTALAPMQHHGSSALLPSGPMLAAHVVGAAVTYLVWRLRARAIRAVVHWLRAVTVPVSRVATVTSDGAVLTARTAALTIGPRGPPWRRIPAALSVALPAPSLHPA